ncbi:MAG: ankyrin repeat domain-containing protein, partial [Bryobacteraceae bacterium]
MNLNSRLAYHYSLVDTCLSDTPGGADVNFKSRLGVTALMSAARSGGLDTMEALLSRRVEVDAQNANGSTALMRAVERGRQDLTKALLQRGANVNLKDNLGRTALMRAAVHGHARIEGLLL